MSEDLLGRSTNQLDFLRPEARIFRQSQQRTIAEEEDRKAQARKVFANATTSKIRLNAAQKF